MEKIAILSGGGTLPNALYKTAKHRGLDVAIVVFKGQPQPDDISFNNITKEVSLGAVGSTIKWLLKENVDTVVFAGHLSKPSLFDLRLDAVAFELMNKLRKKGDDTLLSAIAKLMEREGLRVIGAHELQPDLLMRRGALGDYEPTRDEFNDIDLAVEALHATSHLDLGQAAVVKEGVIIGLEGVEGTDELLHRCAPFRASSGKSGKGGLLVKLPKLNQDRRFDLPTIGPETVKLLRKYKYSGVAVKSGETLVMDQDKVYDNATSGKVFVFGIR